jgi:hypothetical protein
MAVSDIHSARINARPEETSPQRKGLIAWLDDRPSIASFNHLINSDHQT